MDCTACTPLLTAIKHLTKISLDQLMTATHILHTRLFPLTYTLTVDTSKVALNMAYVYIPKD